MVIYNFYCADYESCYNNLLWHPEDRTQKHFEKDCRAALEECGADYIQTEESWVTTDNWIREAVKILVHRYGYKHPKEISYGPANSQIVGFNLINYEKYPAQDQNLENREYAEKDIAELKQLLPQYLVDSAVDKNRRLDRDLDKEREARKPHA